MGALDQNYVVKSENGTDISNLINSQIYDNGTNVGIGHTSPSEKLHVLGTIKVDDGTNYGLLGNASGSLVVRSYGASTAEPIKLQQQVGATTTDRITLDNTGGIFIGNPTNNAESIWVVPPPASTGNDTNDATTNRTRIQNAINQVAENGGGTVILQKGRYLLNKAGTNPDYAIRLRRGVHLKGVSMIGTVLVPIQNGTSVTQKFELIQIEFPSTDVYPTTTISDVRILNDYSGGRSNITGINVGNYSDDDERDPQPTYVQNVWIEGCTTGIVVGTWFSELHNCKIFNCPTGIDLSYNRNRTNPASPIWNSTNNCLVLHCHLWSVTTGINVRGMHNKIIASSIGGIANGGYGIWINDGDRKGNYICGNKIECPNGGTAKGIKLNSCGNTAIGNFFDLSAGNEFDLNETYKAGNVIMSNFNRCHGAGDVVRLSEINTELSVCRVVGSATGKQQIADFSVYGNSANTHILLYGNGNDNSANWINTSGSEKLILGDGNNPDTMAVTGGNVGIGTTSPGAKLDVNGNIKASGAGNGIILTSPNGTYTKKIRLKNDGTGIEIVDP